MEMRHGVVINQYPESAATARPHKVTRADTGNSDLHKHSQITEASCVILQIALADL